MPFTQDNLPKTYTAVIPRFLRTHRGRRICCISTGVFDFSHREAEEIAERSICINAVIGEPWAMMRCLYGL